MILNSIACNREIIYKRKSQKDVLNLTVVLRNCHSNPNHQELPPWSVGSHQFWGKTQDDDLLKAQGIARIFFFQLLNHGLPFATPLTTACQATLSSTISSILLKFMSLSQWCHLTISSSAAPFSFCLQFCPSSESFPMSWLIAIRWPKIFNSQYCIEQPDTKEIEDLNNAVSHNNRCNTGHSI